MKNPDRESAYEKTFITIPSTIFLFAGVLFFYFLAYDSVHKLGEKWIGGRTGRWATEFVMLILLSGVCGVIYKIYRNLYLGRACRLVVMMGAAKLAILVGEDLAGRAGKDLAPVIAYGGLLAFFVIYDKQSKNQAESRLLEEAAEENS